MGPSFVGFGRRRLWIRWLMDGAVRLYGPGPRLVGHLGLCQFCIDKVIEFVLAGLAVMFDPFLMDRTGFFERCDIGLGQFNLMTLRPPGRCPTFPAVRRS